MSAPNPIPIQFGTQIVEHPSGPVSQELAENLYLEQAPQGAKSRTVLLGTPGLKAFASPGAGLVRGLADLNGYLFAVIGETLYRVASDGTSETIGTVEGSQAVDIKAGTTHVWIAAPPKLYAANEDEILEMPEGGMVGVAAQDGYMLAVRGGGQDWFIAGPDDATTIDALDVTQADALPGNNVGCVSDDREFLVFQSRCVTAYVNTGAAAFPFERREVVETGCVSGRSIARAGGAVFWLGSAREGGLQVYSMVGYQPKPLAPPWIVAMIEAQESPQTAQGFAYQQGGHTHYVLTFSGLTLTYDASTGLWHRRRSDGLDRWRVSAHAWVESWRKHIVGDYSTGALYELDTGTYSEAGSVLRRRAVGAPVWANGQRFIVDEFMLDIESGVGLVTGQGSDPQAVLDWSSDGGKTWSNELWRTFGEIGQYGVQARWRRLGAHRNWMPRITITDPVPVRIAGAYARVEALAA